MRTIKTTNMAYIYKKQVKGRSYYYLRISLRKGDKIIAKDIAYLGNDPGEIQKNLDQIPNKYKAEVRKGYKTISKFVESNNYLEKVKRLKIKSDDLLDKQILLEIEAAKLHWTNKFQKLDELTKKEILKNFIVEFSYNTASIEGNTITLKEARNLLFENKTPKDKDLREIYDLQNTETTFNWILNIKEELSHELIMEIHKQLMKNIDLRTGYRTRDVIVLHSRFDSTPAPYVKTDMDILLDWYKKNTKILHPFSLAIIFHHKFEKIHPFMDGNGRTGRMLLNYILIKNDCPPIIIRNAKRKEYLKALNKADEVSLTDSRKKDYGYLINVASDELVNSYWSIFL